MNSKQDLKKLALLGIAGGWILANNAEAQPFDNSEHGNLLAMGCGATDGSYGSTGYYYSNSGNWNGCYSQPQQQQYYYSSYDQQPNQGYGATYQQQQVYTQSENEVGTNQSDVGYNNPNDQQLYQQHQQVLQTIQQQKTMNAAASPQNISRTPPTFNQPSQSQRTQLGAQSSPVQKGVPSTSTTTSNTTSTSTSSATSTSASQSEGAPLGGIPSPVQKGVPSTSSATSTSTSQSEGAPLGATPPPVKKGR